jgi:hypothetical protein
LILKNILLAVALASLVWVPAPAQLKTAKAPDAAASNPPTSAAPFTVGEKLEYEVSWSSFLVAGELILETKARTSVDGIDAYHVSATAQSVGLVNLTVLKVKEVYDSFISAATLQPFRAEKSSRRGKKRAQGTIKLDQQNGKATLEDGRALEIPQGTYDLASLLYAIRAIDFTPGKSRIFTLIEDGKLYDLSVTVEGGEKLTTRTGTYNVIKLSTKAVGNRSNKDPYKLKIFVTNDAQRLPVLITAEPAWGEVRVDLISATGTQGSKK